ncbi:MAG: hypothetical protein WCK88_02610 [bacterium]
MSNINSWNTGEPAILSVLFPILFIMSDEATTPVDETVAPATEKTCADGTPCTDESCTPAVEETATEAPTETEATPAE